MSSDLPKIFCVDDHPANLKLLKSSLSDFDCILLESGSACLGKLEEMMPDLVLLDVMMPGIDGFETCRKIREKYSCDFLPVIFVSAKDDIQDRLQGYAAGGDDYICKPFAQEELRAKVCAQIKRKTEVDKTRERAEVSDVLLNSLQETSHVVNFLQNVLLMRTDEQVAGLVIKTLKNLELDCAVETRFDGHLRIFSEDTGNQLEKSVFEYVKHRGRLVSFGEKLAINFPLISLIVRNMPGQDQRFSSRIKDYLALMVNGANSRLTVLEQDQANLQKYNMLIEFMSELKDILSTLDESYDKHKKFSEEILSSVYVDMEASFMHLALTESQEEELRSIIEQAENRIQQENDSFSGVHKQFSSMSRQIDTVLGHTLSSIQAEAEPAETSEIVVLF